MIDIPPLDTFGRRIMICGPSNAGKSTLAAALSRKLGVPPVYIDLLRHEPGTDWQLRPDDEFHRLHAEAIAGERWVMEGNYSSLYAERTTRATGIIMLDTDRFSALYRYVRRTLFERGRYGGLSGDRDSLKFWLAHYILVVQPKKRARDIAKLRPSGLPMLLVDSMAETNRLYAAWGLTRG
jgi:adenylate kinase family enzyme